MPTLVLLRHAKAEAHAASDATRRLSSAGRAQCADVRAWLELQGVAPDRVLVSSATRAGQTWDLAGLGSVPPLRATALYTAGVEELRELIAQTPARVATLVVVGHNPTCEQLAWALDDSPAARERTDRGLAPAGAAIFALASWDAPHGRLLAWRD